MNKQFKEIAEDAGIDVELLSKAQSEMLVKFSTLIIQECAAITNHFSDGHSLDQFGRKLFHYTSDIGKVITEHFGVEE